MAKCLLNSVISTPEAKCMCADASNFYLMTPMERKEYMQFRINLIPGKILDEYNLHEIMHKDCVYAETVQGMYGLAQAGRLANKLLAQHLAKHGYYQVLHTPGLWEHTTCPIQFALVVDDFCVKYVGQEHAEHLLGALNKHYMMAMDWNASLFCSITLQWDYNKCTV